MPDAISDQLNTEESSQGRKGHGNDEGVAAAGIITSQEVEAKYADEEELAGPAEIPRAETLSVCDGTVESDPSKGEPWVNSSGAREATWGRQSSDASLGQLGGPVEDEGECPPDVGEWPGESSRSSGSEAEEEPAVPWLQGSAAGLNGKGFAGRRGKGEPFRLDDRLGTCSPVMLSPRDQHMTEVS
ncbi:unnamed protein product [Chrysoparadoxa australica]